MSSHSASTTTPISYSPSSPPFVQVQHDHHFRRHSVSSSHHEGSSDNLSVPRSNVSSSVDSNSSFADDILFSPDRELRIDFFHGQQRCSLIIEEGLRAEDVCHLLVVKLNLNSASDWSLALRLDDVGVMRVLENDEEVYSCGRQYEALKCRFAIETTPTKFDFLENPGHFFPLDMITLGEKEFLDNMSETARREKLKILRDRLFNCRKLSITVLGPLKFFTKNDSGLIETRNLAAQLTLDGSNDQLLCNEVESGVKTQFDVLHCSVFTPVDESQCKPHVIIPNNCQDEFLFCLISDRDSSISWFAATDHLQRLCWVTCLRLIKFSLSKLRNNYLTSRRVHQFNAANDATKSSHDPLHLRHQFASHKSSSWTMSNASIATLPVATSCSSSYSSGSDATITNFLSRSPILTTCAAPMTRNQRERPWFFPKMSREEAQTKLEKFVAVDGVFLVRPSCKNPDVNVLSYIYNKQINHRSIHIYEDHGHCCLSLDIGRTKFYDMCQLIEFYQLNLGCLPTKLSHYLVQK